MRGYPERTLATRAKWLLDTREDVEVSTTEWVAEMEAILKEIANAPEADLVRDAAPDIWRVMCGDWREETVAIHNSEGWIADGLDLKKAAALVEAHNGSLGLGVEASGRDKKGGAA